MASSEIHPVCLNNRRWIFYHEHQHSALVQDYRNFIFSPERRRQGIEWARFDFLVIYLLQELRTTQDQTEFWSGFPDLSPRDLANIEVGRSNIPIIAKNGVIVQQEEIACRNALYDEYCSVRGIEVRLLRQAIAEAQASALTAEFSSRPFNPYASDPHSDPYADPEELREIDYKREVAAEAERIRARGHYLPMTLSDDAILADSMQYLTVLENDLEQVPTSTTCRLKPDDETIMSQLMEALALSPDASSPGSS